jgi:histone-lysine N-methyltransferase SETMAR
LNATVTVKTTCEVEEENVVNRRTVSDWFQRLASGDNTLDDRPRSGRPSVVDPQELRVPLEDQHYGTTRELLATLGPSQRTINRHLDRSDLTCKCPREDPHELTDAQAQRRVDICTTLLCLIVFGIVL